MPVEEVTPAIVLRTRDYLESDRIATLLTEHAGKLGGIAKGAKASRRRFERRLEPFSHVMLYFRRRPLGGGEANAALRQAYELRMFRWAGFGMQFDRCRVCAESQTGSAAVYFII